MKTKILAFLLFVSPAYAEKSGVVDSNGYIIAYGSGGIEAWTNTINRNPGSQFRDDIPNNAKNIRDTQSAGGKVFRFDGTNYLREAHVFNKPNKILTREQKIQSLVGRLNTIMGLTGNKRIPSKPRNKGKAKWIYLIAEKKSRSFIVTANEDTERRITNALNRLREVERELYFMYPFPELMNSNSFGQ